MLASLSMIVVVTSEGNSVLCPPIIASFRNPTPYAMPYSVHSKGFMFKTSRLAKPIDQEFQRRNEASVNGYAQTWQPWNLGNASSLPSRPPITRQLDPFLYEYSYSPRKSLVRERQSRWQTHGYAKDVPCDADRADVRHYSNVSRIRANELVPQGGMQQTLLLILILDESDTDASSHEGIVKASSSLAPYFRNTHTSSCPPPTEFAPAPAPPSSPLLNNNHHHHHPLSKGPKGQSGFSRCGKLLLPPLCDLFILPANQLSYQPRP